MKTVPALNSRWCIISARYFTSLGGSDAKRATCLRICSFMKRLIWIANHPLVVFLVSWNFNREHVGAVVPLIIHAPRQAPNKADPPAAGLALLETLLEVGLRSLTSVEGMSVVEYPQAKAVCQACDAERDAVLQLIVVAILDDVGADFLGRQLGLITRLRTARLPIEKLAHAFDRPHQGRHRVWKSSLPCLRI